MLPAISVQSQTTAWILHVQLPKNISIGAYIGELKMGSPLLLLVYKSKKDLNATQLLFH